MRRIAAFRLVSAAIAIALLIGETKNSTAQISPTPGTPQMITNQRAITVVGQGLAVAPADTAKIEFRLGNRAPTDQPLTQATVASADGNLALPVEVALKPVVDALVAIKVPLGNIQLRSSSLDNPKLVVELNKPTRDRVQEVVKVVTSALSSDNNLFIQGIGAEYGVKNCVPLERTARRAALRDALTQAQIIALDLGIKVGDILFVTVYPSFGSPASSSCGSKVGVPVSSIFSVSESSPPYDPSANPEVKLRMQVSITYAIQ
jgi:uncharacterized protein YggE